MTHSRMLNSQVPPPLAQKYAKAPAWGLGDSSFVSSTPIPGPDGVEPSLPPAPREKAVYFES